jgi:hypothetical protein
VKTLVPGSQTILDFAVGAGTRIPLSGAGQIIIAQSGNVDYVRQEQLNIGFQVTLITTEAKSFKQQSIVRARFIGNFGGLVSRGQRRTMMTQLTRPLQTMRRSQTMVSSQAHLGGKWMIPDFVADAECRAKKYCFSERSSALPGDVGNVAL